ncbi:ferritin-like domain-containing protein [Frankia sp. Ag45/Mut15]|uniref:Ferritin-like domain-containing protein n=1 Tax=Frankia umida TaxID=573489 RepID=A0ABT0JSJ0_9ACTN|nr:ferritin-like domain-containing protein [Frankia umida]MCK9874532.1 ferritin-like domain-containing protein [Frankia umida]
MSTRDLYTQTPETDRWAAGAGGHPVFTWEYDPERGRLLDLYQKGKDRQWDSTTRIDWDLPVDPEDPLGIPDEANVLYGTDHWNRMSATDRTQVRRHAAAWQFSQFLHGEQGALICAARIVETSPGLDAKLYSATQVVDEARHVEIYTRFLHEKIGLLYPINDSLQGLLADSLNDSRWDLPYLGMQVLIEGLALAAFGLIRDATTQPLAKQLLTYVMQDEARHVAFGRIALRDYYRQLSDAELREREEFVIEGCHLMRDRIQGLEVLENLGLRTDEARRIVEASETMRLFRTLLFARVVPCVKDIGLWGPRLRQAYLDLGVLDLGDADLDLLMAQDDAAAEALDVARVHAAQEQRVAEVHATIAAGQNGSAAPGPPTAGRWR